MSRDDIFIKENSVIIKFKYNNDKIQLLWKELVYYNKKYEINEYKIHFAFEKDLSDRQEKNVTADFRRIVNIKDYDSFKKVWFDAKNDRKEYYHFQYCFELELTLTNLGSKKIRKRYIPKQVYNRTC